MIIEVAGRARADAALDQSAKVEMVLPRSAVGLDDLRRNPEELDKGSLAHFVAAVAGQLMREGVTFVRADDDSGGLRLHLTDRGVGVDLTDRAVADVMLVHLQPRFRALVEGVVK